MTTNSPIPEISVQELRHNRAQYFLLDVRRDDELQIAALDHNIQIEMSQIPARYEELKDLAKDKKIAVLCRSGGRSEKVTAFLRHKGYNAYNVAGGILAWADTIDDSLQKY